MMCYKSISFVWRCGRLQLFFSFLIFKQTWLDLQTRRRWWTTWWSAWTRDPDRHVITTSSPAATSTPASSSEASFSTTQPTRIPPSSILPTKYDSGSNVYSVYVILILCCYWCGCCSRFWMLVFMTCLLPFAVTVHESSSAIWVVCLVYTATIMTGTRGLVTTSATWASWCRRLRTCGRRVWCFPSSSRPARGTTTPSTAARHVSRHFNLFAYSSEISIVINHLMTRIRRITCTRFVIDCSKTVCS